MSGSSPIDPTIAMLVRAVLAVENQKADALLLLADMIDEWDAAGAADGIEETPHNLLADGLRLVARAFVRP